MHKNKMRGIAVVLCLTAVMGCGLIGCSDSREADRLIAYISSDSAVYSSTAEVVKSVANAVVEIRTESVTSGWGGYYTVSGAGSGVIVAHDDKYETYYIITNNHVIEGAKTITVTLRTGEEYEAELVATDERGDIGVISIKEKQSLGVVKWGDSDELQIGEDLIAIGNPLGKLGGTVTKGILSAKERSIPVGNHTMTLLQTDTAINPGNSGGGLFNMKGDLVGIVNAKTTDEEVEGICFAIPINEARRLFNDLVSYGVVTDRATFNIIVDVWSPNSATDKDVYVLDASGAPSGTFTKYDKIVSVNGRSVIDLLSYNDALSTVKPGDTVSVSVRHGQIVSTAFGYYLRFESQVSTFDVKASALKRS